MAALAEHAPQLRVTRIAAGLHVLVELPPGTEKSVLQSAAWQGLSLEGPSRFRYGPEPVPGQDRDALVVAHGTPPDHAFGGVLQARRTLA